MKHQMTLTEEIFRKYRISENALEAYGFTEHEDGWHYEKTVHEGEFLLKIRFVNGEMHARLLDTSFGDEFTRINSEDAVGDFVVSLRKECGKILTDIRDKCATREEFISPQTNRIASLIEEKYQVKPEYLWEKFPGYAVYRNRESRKWFGIIMNLPEKKIRGNEERETEVINLRLDENVEEYLLKEGVYPAYHMSKKNWVSVMLDDTLDDEAVMDMIDISEKGSRKKEKRK